MSNYAIKVEGLGKRYRIGERQRYKALRDVLADVAYAPVRAAGRLLHREDRQPRTDSHIWALKDVSFEVQHGEVLGIIGRNGAGKSTLLKILSRISEPTEGEVRLRGRVGSLLEVGTGFHPELTGRDNVYLNGAILGMRRHEIERKFDEIVAFAEIEKFLDTPVKHYSSGMYVRLAFAVAAHLEPEILLVDEVLAVGDAAFQRKCLGKMGEVAGEGRTVLFVSHNMAAVQALCHRVVLLEQGRIAANSKPLDVIERYSFQIEPGDGVFDLVAYPRTGGDGRALIERLTVVNSSLRPTPSISLGEGIGFEIQYRSSVPPGRVEFVIGVYNSILQRVCQFSSARSGFTDASSAGEGRVRCLLRSTNFNTGRYYLNLGLNSLAREDAYDHVTQAAAFDVLDSDVFGTGKVPDPQGGPCFFHAEWTRSIMED